MKTQINKLEGQFSKDVRSMEMERGRIVRILDLAYSLGFISRRERDITYYKIIDWRSLADCSERFGLSKSRIAQIVYTTIFKIDMNENIKHLHN